MVAYVPLTDHFSSYQLWIRSFQTRIYELSDIKVTIAIWCLSVGSSHFVTYIVWLELQYTEIVITDNDAWNKTVYYKKIYRLY